MNDIFAVIGGDDRQAYLANSLQQNGYTVLCSGLENCPILTPGVIQEELPIAVLKAGIIVLPLPVSKDGVTIHANNSYSQLYLSEVFTNAKKEQLIVGGKLDENLKNAANERELNIVDYLEREEMSILNSIPTAEGALEIAIRETDITIHSSKCLVAGFGRIGRILAKMLRDLGADVTVCARKCPDLAWIKQAGCRAIQTMDVLSKTRDYDIIFNTIPAMVFDRKKLSKITNKSSILMIDLASAPGGIDYETANRMGIKAIHALSLPGKVAPKTAAAIIRDTIFNIVQEVKHG